MAFLKSFGAGRRTDVLDYDPHKVSSPQVFLLSMVVFLAIVAPWVLNAPTIHLNGRS